MIIKQNHKQMQSKDLYKIAAGLNIEGGFPYLDIIKDHKIWVNLVLILDRPLVDGILFDDMLKLLDLDSKEYSILENTVENLNEHTFLAVYLMIIGYYISTSIANGKVGNLPKIIIHIHQDGNLKTCQTLKKLIKQYVDSMMTYYDMKADISYDVDNYTYITTKHKYDCDVLISLSQCAGLDPELETGTFIVPTEFIPFYVKENVVCLDKTYQVVNDLRNSIDSILASKYCRYATDYVNGNYLSSKLSKNEKYKVDIKREYFSFGPIMQVDDLWNPTDSNKVVYVDL